ncbi:MAG TPA: UvrD-helicase domain-containing protein [Bryobacteraceae bacterium]|jgi:DNA helicase-2/ATP-dependent DNA helicase PcrA
MDFLQGLNPQQREAVACTEGPLLILAGAGSGKTRVITHRIAHLVTAKRVPPSAILAVTFTNKAAKEMRERVHKLIAADEPDDCLSSPRLFTFHSFCVRLLRADGDPLAQVRPGFTRRFSIYDDDDQLSIVKAAFKLIGIDDKELPHRSVLSRISQAKNRADTPDDLFKCAKTRVDEQIAVCYQEYEKALRNANALDFDDLLLETVRLLRHDAATRETWNRRLGYVMIDEYQDTNRPQYQLMRLLTTEHDNVCVVGDEDQSIYSWRGADINNILDFEKDYKNARVIRLEQNYRSTKNILEAASAVVANNTQRKGKWLWTESGPGELLTLYPASDGENEALFIADSIEKILAVNPDWHVAILYRTNSQSRQIEEALRRYGRKYSVVGGFSFYQRAEIKDIIAYLRLAIQPDDSVSLLRIINTPARGIGRSTIEQVDQFAIERNLSRWSALVRMIDENLFPTRAFAAMSGFRQTMQELSLAVGDKPLDKALEFIYERSGYKQMLETDRTPEALTRRENIEELITAAAEAVERGDSPSDFLDHAALVSDADQVDERATVSLLTIHNAKGLEFPVVFLAGMEEGLFPHSRSIDNPTAMEEERRLCYVGMTRAEKRLIMSWARWRRRFGFGEPQRSIASRFLREVPAQLLFNIGVEDDENIPQIDLTAERHAAQQGARKNLFTGKTYNSIDNISQFFAERGLPGPGNQRPGSAPGGAQAGSLAASGAIGRPGNNNSTPPAPPASRFNTPIPPRAATTPPLPKAPPPPKTGSRQGTVVEHPKYGTGTVIRREGEGPDAKLTVLFPGHGLKKLVERYAGLKKT